MANQGSPIGTTQPYIPAVNQTQIGQFVGLHLHFPTFAAYQAAVASEQSNITGASGGGAAGLWALGQPLTIATEPPDTYRVWDPTQSIGAVLGHATRVVIRPGLSYTLAADSNTVYAGAGLPSNGLGNANDISIDYAGNCVYIKNGTAGSTWNATPVIAAIFTAAGASAWGGISGTIAAQTDLTTLINNSSPDPFAGMTSAQILASGANVTSYFNGYNSGTAAAARVAIKDATFTYTPKAGATALTSTIWFDSTNKIIQVSAWS